MRATPLLLAGAVVLATAASPAAAAPKKKPITKTYEATAIAPDPTNSAPSSPYEVCAQTVPGSFHTHAFKAPAPGKLVVELSNFQVDWDLLITDSKGTGLASSGNGGYGTPAAPSMEKASVKIKRAGTYNIIACNWAGTPTATVKYVFTYA